MTHLDLLKKKQQNQKQTWITCYDSLWANLLNTLPFDAYLVGDSVSMTMHGHVNTLSATLEMMELHTAAVARTQPKAFLIADMPFMSFRKSESQSLEAMERLMRAGAQAVKLEGCLGNEELIERATQSGIPVVGHLGLTPQFVNLLGGYKVQGKTEEAQVQIRNQAKEIEKRGAVALVLECVPEVLSAQISQDLRIPVIGIGAGAKVDGQILVLFDLLGLTPGKLPKFVRNFAPEVRQALLNGFQNYISAVENQSFPGREETY